jgi:hypothetical protein
LIENSYADTDLRPFLGGNRSMMGSRVMEIKDKDLVMAKSRTVILWGREDPLGRGVEFFLASRKEWEVIRITDNFDANYLYQEVERVKPDVVIIYQGDCADDTDVPAQLMKDRPNLKVITVSLENNSVEVYSKQQVMVTEVSDLFSIVEA